MSKVAFVSYFDSEPHESRGYKIPFSIMDLKEDDFVLVPLNGNFTVAKIKKIVSLNDFEEEEILPSLDYVESKIFINK
jgi:hypothetical protein